MQELFADKSWIQLLSVAHINKTENERGKREYIRRKR